MYSHKFLKLTRLLHLYLGVFITPALIFFAFTGALQTFSLHETTRGSSYKPPAWAVLLAQIHKKQTPVVPVRKQPPVDKPVGKAPMEKPASEASAQEKPLAVPSQPTPKPDDASAPKPHNALPLKIFFLFVAIGLFASTLTGLYMSYKYIRNRNLITAVLVAGVILPILLTIL
jgi:hypothetical protein